MPDFVLFLRAVNVAGRSVPMAALRHALAEAGFLDVESHIQSGNLRVRTPDGPPGDAADVAAAVERVVLDLSGVSTTAIVRSPSDVARILATGDAFADPHPEGSRRYVALLREEPAAERAAELDAWDVPGECAKVLGREVYLWFTGPFHAARLNNARIERAGVVATTRDWKVLSAVARRWAP